jgi:ParB family transcriptional regulator, chromosome partitioning protein
VPPKMDRERGHPNQGVSIMHIDHIPLDHLSVSKANMRSGKKPPDISDILPSIIKRGVISPLFVRPNCEAGHFEIVAGKRRYYASLEAARRGKDDVTLPCITLGEGDDAEALEVSMIENMLRQNPDQVTQWESYTRLVKEGRSVDDIAATFALSTLQVKRILALGNLLPRIRDAFRAEEIDAATVKHLTLASKAQQKAWLALFEDTDGYAPRGQQLKAWLFGGASISVGVALFDMESFAGQIVTNLFEEDGYFADADAFWSAQMAEVETRKGDYLEAGWADVQIVPPGEHFSSWEYEKTPKGRAGRVYVQCRDNGEVTFHEGYVTAKEARAKRKGGDEGSTCPQPAPKRPEMTSALTAYVDLHRHAAVRVELASRPSVALRVAVAHMVCGSPLWSLKIADQHTRNDAINESVETCKAETAFDERRRAVLACLGFDAERASVAQHYGSDIVPLVDRLLDLPDAVIMEVMALVMAETLAVGSELIETLGPVLSVDMANYWQADPVFYDLLRDREVMTTILAEVGGAAVASANAKEKGKVIKGVIADFLTGSNNRPKVDGWVPKWMAFPPSAYTDRGGVATVAAASRAKWLAEADLDPNPAVADAADLAEDVDTDTAEPSGDGEEQRLAA